MAAKNKIKEIAQQIKNHNFLNENFKGIKELLSDKSNLEYLYQLIASEKNFDYLELAKKLYIEIPDKYIIESLKHSSNITPNAYYILFSLFNKKLIRSMDEVRKHFDKKTMAEAEIKCINSWMSRERNNLRKEREKFFVPPSSEIEAIYSSISVSEFYDDKVKRRKMDKNIVYDFSIPFKIEECFFNFAYKKEEIGVFINLDCLIFNKHIFNDPLKEKVTKYVEFLVDEWISMENKEFLNINEGKVLKNNQSVAEIKTPKSASPARKNEVFEFRDEINGISFPNALFEAKLQLFSEKYEKDRPIKLINEFDKGFHNRINHLIDFINELRENKINFQCFTRTKNHIFACRLFAFGLGFLKKEELFFRNTNGSPADLLTQLYSDKKRVYFFGFKERIYDLFPGRTNYCEVNEYLDFMEYMKNKIKH